MADNQNLLEKLNELSKRISLESFYSINISKYQVSLQGNFNDSNTRFAKELGIKLEYQEDNGMLKGESEDGKLRIVLT
jgi:hypothetical protein